MSKGRKTGGKDFQPGAPPGPGRPPTPEPLKQARRLTKTEFELVVNKYLWCSLEELERLRTDKSLPVMEAWMISIIAKGVATGDWSGNEWLAQRLVGKVKDQLEVTTPKPFIVRHVDGSQTVLGTEAEKKGDE
jgi:hypothetical protein